MKSGKIACVLLCISAFLYVARYISAALLVCGSKLNMGFALVYKEIGAGLTVWAGIALAAGILCLIVQYLQTHNEPPAEVVDELKGIVEKVSPDE